MESADGNLSRKEQSGPEPCETSAGETDFRSGKKRNLIAGLGFFAAIMLLVVMGWFGYRTVTELREANNWVVHTYQVIDKLHGVLTDLLDAETAQRNFIITGDRRHLKPYYAAVTETEKGIATLKGLVGTIGVQHKLVEIEAAVRERLARLETGIEIRKTEGFQAAVANIRSGGGRAIMDRIRSRVAEAVDLERALLEKRSAQEASMVKRVDQARAAGAFLVVGILVAVFTALMREITRRGRVESELQCRQKQLYAVLEERTRANEALRQSEQRFSSFMLHLSAAAWVKDRMGRYVYGNVEHERIFSMPLSEYSGLRDDEFLPEETARGFQENDERVLAEGESLQAIEALRQADGIDRHFLVTKFPVRGPDGRTAYVAGIAQDITERVTAEKALRFSEARFRILHDDNPSMIFTLDAEGRILSSNPACMTHLGYTAEELAGQPVPNIFHEDERPLMAERVQTCLRNPEQVYRWQSRKIHKNGELVWVEELARGVHDLNGAPNVMVVCQDITERKRAEEALQKSERKLAKIFHAVPALISISTLKEGRFVDVNDTMLRTLDYRRDEMIGRTVSELNLWENMSGRMEILRTLEEKGSLRSLEVRFRGKSGQTFVGLFSAEYIDIDDERYMLSLIRDITERKQAEESLQKSERKFARIFHSAPALISISALDDGRVIDINETALQTLGYQREEVIGRTTHEINFWVNESDRTRAIQMLEEQGSVQNFEFEFRGKAGQIFTGLLSGERIDIECERCLLALVKDITLKKRAQEQVDRLNADLAVRAGELEQLNRELANDLEAMKILQKLGMLFLEEANLDQILSQVLDAAIAISCADFGNIQIMNPKSSCLQIAVQHGFPQWWLDFWNNVVEGKGVCGTALGRGERVIVEDIERSPIFSGTKALEIQLKAGVRAVQSTPLVSRSGSILGMFSTHYRAPHRPADRELRLLDLLARHAADFIEKAQMRELLQIRAAELEEANRDLEAFNYTVAHDLRKPLSAVNGYCQLIREFCGDTLDEECKTYLQEAYDGTWWMNRLIDTLLNFSRANRAEPRREKVDLSEMAQAVATGLKQAEPSRRATFRIAEGVSAIGDPGLLRVVLDNLIGNAWKYTGIREEAVIEFGATEIEGQRAFFVRDNGPGFSMEDAGQLFLPFRRLPGAEKQTGFGIGLATVDRIIRRHGGRVWAEGEPEKGATFWFTLGMEKR